MSGPPAERFPLDLPDPLNPLVAPECLPVALSPLAAEVPLCVLLGYASFKLTNFAIRSATVGRRKHILIDHKVPYCV